ncbi:MAG: type I-C CRISPR-associated protein Cas5c [Desulfovibrio sp.]|jgi:CRISPR-associated protein Cas5d|nr:type I-C CRISPR-associated protein Cas5c [Desulfovibrio sp.]
MYGVKLRMFGEYACFTRPEMKGERVSYDIPTPSAVRGVLEAIYWKPALSWRIKAVHVMKPVVFESIRRNELGSKVPVASVKKALKGGKKTLGVWIEDDRQQRASLVLKNVEYCVDAEFVIADQAGPEDRQPGKHLDIFNRRLARGQVFHRPCFGCREFPAFVEPVEEIPASPLAELPEGNRDLGWMLYDLDYKNRCKPMFFRASLVKGVLRVPSPDSSEVRR